MKSSIGGFDSITAAARAAGLKPVDRQQVEQMSSLDNMSNEELQSELDRIFEQEYGLTQDQLKKAVKGQHH